MNRISQPSPRAGSGLDRELYLGRLTRALQGCVKPDDHHARRNAYAKAGLFGVSTRDDIDAAALFRARTIAFQELAA